jgi:8-hydroxy-5-deazaflavin:NADPH oxidoreductase
MGPANRKRVGIIGAGRIGQAMARTALRAGRSVVIANSRGPESLTSKVSTLGDGASAGTVPQAGVAPCNSWAPRLRGEPDPALWSKLAISTVARR